MDAKEAGRLISILESRTASQRQIYSAAHQLGEAGFVEAKPAVEALLASEDDQLRYIALSVLTLHWHCVEHISTCFRLCRSDSDVDVRGMAVAGMGSLARGTRDAKVLRTLLELFDDDTQDWLVRDTAYRALLNVLGRPANEQPSAARSLDRRKDVIWEHVDTARRIAGGLTS